VICSFYVGVRIYEQVFGWYAGIDSFAPELFCEPWCSSGRKGNLR
jgi:hypothetical protein